MNHMQKYAEAEAIGLLKRFYELGNPRTQEAAGAGDAGGTEQGKAVYLIRHAEATHNQRFREAAEQPERHDELKAAGYNVEDSPLTAAEHTTTS